MLRRLYITRPSTVKQLRSMTTTSRPISVIDLPPVRSTLVPHYPGNSMIRPILKNDHFAYFEDSNCVRIIDLRNGHNYGKTENSIDGIALTDRFFAMHDNQQVFISPLDNLDANEDPIIVEHISRSAADKQIIAFKTSNQDIVILDTQTGERHTFDDFRLPEPLDVSQRHYSLYHPVLDADKQALYTVNCARGIVDGEKSFRVEVLRLQYGQEPQYHYSTLRYTLEPGTSGEPATSGRWHSHIRPSGRDSEYKLNLTYPGDSHCLLLHIGEDGISARQTSFIGNAAIWKDAHFAKPDNNTILTSDTKIELSPVNEQDIHIREIFANDSYLIDCAEGRQAASTVTAFALKQGVTNCTVKDLSSTKTSFGEKWATSTMEKASDLKLSTPITSSWQTPSAELFEKPVPYDDWDF